LVKVRLQAVELNAPELPIRLEPLVKFLQGLRADSIEPTLRVGAHLDQPRLLEYPKVFRHRGLTDLQGIDQITNGSLAASQQFEDVAPMGLG
jgi:hypothetical protein